MSSRRPGNPHGVGPAGIGTMGSMPSLSGMSLNAKATPARPVPAHNPEDIGVIKKVPEESYSRSSFNGSGPGQSPGPSFPNSRSSSRSSALGADEFYDANQETPEEVALMDQLAESNRLLEECKADDLVDKQKIARLKDTIAKLEKDLKKYYVGDDQPKWLRKASREVFPEKKEEEEELTSSDDEPEDVPTMVNGRQPFESIALWTVGEPQSMRTTIDGGTLQSMKVQWLNGMAFNPSGGVVAGYTGYFPNHYLYAEPQNVEEDLPYGFNQAPASVAYGVWLGPQLEPDESERELNKWLLAYPEDEEETREEASPAPTQPVENADARPLLGNNEPAKWNAQIPLSTLVASRKGTQGGAITVGGSKSQAYAYDAKEFKATIGPRLNLLYHDKYPNLQQVPHSDTEWTTATSKDFPDHLLKMAWVQMDPEREPTDTYGSIVLVYGEDYDQIEKIELLKKVREKQRRRRVTGYQWSHFS